MINPESLYIHIPYCVSKCSYCDFFSKGCGKNFIPQNYVDALCNELNYRLKDVSSLKTIYIGGGTPSLLSPEQISKISSILKPFIKDSDYEFTIEVNPDDVNLTILESFKLCGVTRISCGIQTLNQEALSFSNRRASLTQNLKALELLNAEWKGEVSLDVICGLPGETEESFKNGIQTLLKYNPDHISMYSLTVEDETPLGKAVNNNDIIIDYDFQDKLWFAGKKELEDSGFVHYEVSNFAREGKECKHNLCYWTHKSYIGAGCGGCGTLYNMDGSGLRWTNKPDIEGYINFWNKDDISNGLFQNEENIDLETSVFEFFMMGFRKLSGITNKEFFDTFHFSIPEKYIQVFEKWNQHKLLEFIKQKDETRYCLNKDGILLLNSFLRELI